MGQPFSRFNALMAAAVALMASSAGGVANLSQAVTQLGGYKSRGHGIKTRAPSRSPECAIRPGNHCNPPGRYPEQSDRQALRRFRRAQGGPGLDADNMPRGYYKA